MMFTKKLEAKQIRRAFRITDRSTLQPHAVGICSLPKVESMEKHHGKAPCLIGK